jgi:pimeloyl-ACP methyl ester carboxylesterase
MSAVFLDDALVHYEVMGRGQPVIFLHTWVGSWRYWIPTMQAMSTRFRAYALDLWGFGDTTRATGRYSLEHQVRLVTGFIDEMGLGEVSLVGHGLGGVIATYFAADHPGSTKRLVAVSFPMGNGTINGRLLTGSVVDLASWLIGREQVQNPSWEDAVKASPAAIQESLSQYLKVNWRQLLLRTKVPSLWIHGGKDPAVGLPPADQLQFLPAGGQHFIFQDAGHYPMLQEASIFNRLVADFLTFELEAGAGSLQLKMEWKRRVR